ncbi:MAG TPA: ABC transporter permease [Chitinophagaceae bacterium]|nr:ABC transporter permease [Chitinophagaceae bacterium]
MFKNYLQTALRSLWKHRTATFINALGLTIGLTACLLIALFIRYQLSFDRFQRNGDRIARVIMEYRFDGGNSSGKGNFTSVRVAPVFRRTFPEVESATIMFSSPRVVRVGERMFSEKRFLYADSSFFTLFSFPLLRGDPRTALTASHDVVLTASAARRYFGEQDPLGQTLKVGNDSLPYRVTAVMQDFPANSQIQGELIASFASLGLTPDYEDTYWDANYTTYLLLKDRASIARLQAKLPAFMKKEMQGSGATINFELEPFDRIHLYSPYDSFVPNSSITYIYILGAVALFILVIACSTYINLSTARSLERAREVGVRKVIGAGRSQLFWQFMGESFLLCLLAVLLSLAAAALLLPAFNRLTGESLDRAGLFSPLFLLGTLVAAALVSLLAGSYPALVLTAFQPVRVLKGSFKNTGSGQGLRRSLIVFQFGISVFLIISTLIVRQQLAYIQHAKLGYDREHVLVLPMDDRMLGNLPVIKETFRRDPDVLAVSRCVRSPVEGGGGYSMRTPDMPENRLIAVTANPVDEDYLPATGLQLVAGGNFTRQDILDVTGDSTDKYIYHFILNESAARQLGWSPQQAIGRELYMGQRHGYVRGVVKDYHFESLHSPIKPYVLFPELWGRELLVKLSGQHMARTIGFLQQQWKTLVPHRPFEYHFMDEDYDRLYQAELRLGQVMDLFAGLAVVLACLGLFGLSAYSAQQRLKEVGIRRVLGASVGQILVALSRDFLRLTLLAILLALPLAWWATSRWLEDFAYRARISWLVYAGAALVTLILAMGTVSLRALRAARANPVKSLRTE